MGIMKNFLQRIRLKRFGNKRINRRDLSEYLDFINRNSLYLKTPIAFANQNPSVSEINRILKKKITEDPYVGVKYVFRNRGEKVFFDYIFDDTLYLKWRSFHKETAEQIKQLLYQHKGRNVILDLRGNMGGEIESAVSIADLFLDKGEICKLKYKEKEQCFWASPGSRRFDKIVLFIDNNTMSSAELFYLALYLNLENVWLIGMKSFGKYQGQIIYNNGRNKWMDCYVTAFEWTVNGVNVRDMAMRTNIGKRVICSDVSKQYMEEAAKLLT